MYLNLKKIQPETNHSLLTPKIDPTTQHTHKVILLKKKNK